MADAAVWITGTGPDKQLNFRLPTGGKGDKGDKGDRGTDGSNVLPTDSAIAAAVNDTASATRAALNTTVTDKLRGSIPKWAPNTAYAKGSPVIAPDGSQVLALAAFTSGATYDPANWSANRGYVTMAGTNPSNIPVLKTANDGKAAVWEYIHNGNSGYLWHLLAGAQSGGGWMMGIGLDGGSGGFFIQRNKAAAIGIKLEQTATISTTTAYAMAIEQRSQSTAIFAEQFTEATAPILHLVSYKNDATQSLARWTGYTAGSSGRIRSNDGALEMKADIEMYSPSRFKTRSNSTVTNPDRVMVNESTVVFQAYAGSGTSYYYRRLQSNGSNFRIQVANTQSSETEPSTWYDAVNFKYAASAAQIGFYGATPVNKPTGVAVTPEAIHAALVSLGLIAA